MNEQLETTADAEEVPAVDELETQPARQSLVGAMFIGTAAGIIGASLGWFLVWGQFAEQRPERPAVSVSQAAAEAQQQDAAPQAGWYLQVGAYRRLDGAQESANLLISAGFDVEISEQGDLHRLLVGPLDSEEELAQTKTRLAAAMGADLNRTIPGPWLPVRSINN